MLDYFNIEQYLQTLPTTVGRYVKIMPAASGGDGYITLSQIQVIDMNGNNIAKGAAVGVRSSAANSASPFIVVDGFTRERGGAVNVWTSGGDRANDYFVIDLGATRQISQVIYSGQVDASAATAARARGMICQILAERTFAVITQQTFPSAANNQALTFLNAINLTPSPTGESVGILNPFLMPINTAQPEVFLVSGNYTKSQAIMTCGLLGASTATQGQLREAYNNGARWGSPGWTIDGNDAYYPSATGVQTTIAGTLPNTDATQMTITNGTRAIITATTGVNCFGVKPVQGVNSSIQPFSSSAWTQYVGNSAPVFYGSSSVSVPDVQKLYSHVTPKSWAAANTWTDLHALLKSTAPLNFLYDEASTPINTITGLNSTIQLFGTVSATAIADMNASMNLSSKIFLGSIGDVEKYINIAYTDLKPYIRNNVGWQNFCTTELVQRVSAGTGDYVIEVVAANQTSNQSKCNTALTTDMLGLLPGPARDFIINWVYNRTQRLIKFSLDKLKVPDSLASAQGMVANFTQDQKNSIIITYPFSSPETSAFKANPATGRMKMTVGGAPIAIDVTNTYTLNTIAQSFYEAMGGNYAMTQIYDVFTIGGSILDVRFDLTKHADISVLTAQIAALKTKYNTVRESNVSKDILDAAKQNYQEALSSLQTAQSTNTLPPVVGVVGRFFYTYSTTTSAINITGFTLDARAVTSFIPELNGGIQASTGGAAGSLNYTPTTVYTKNVPEALNCTDPMTLRRIFDDYLDMTVTDLAPTLLGTLGADGETYTGPGGAPSMDTTLGTVHINQILGAVQVSPTQCAIKWTETLWNDISNQPFSAALTKLTRRALFSYTSDTADWYASELSLDATGFAFYTNDTIPSCVFNPAHYQTLISPRLDSLNAATDVAKIRSDFLANSWNNGMGPPCPDTIPNYVFNAVDYCAANPDINNVYNNGGKGPTDFIGAKNHYSNNGLSEGRALRKPQPITPLNPVISIPQPIPANTTLDDAAGGCSNTTCEDLNVLYSLADQYNQDPTQAGTILRITRAFTPNPNQCDIEADINYDTTVTNAEGESVKKGSFSIDDAGEEVAVTTPIPKGITRGETRALSVYREISDCSFVLDSVDISGSGTTIQSNLPVLYKPMEYAAQFQLANDGLIGASLGNIASAVADAAATANSVLSTYRQNTVAAVGNLATLAGGAKCSDTAVLNSLLTYYKTQNLHRKQINTVLRVGTLNSTTCDITFQEDTLAGTGPTYTVASSTTAGLRFTMANGTPTAMSYILPAAPPSVAMDMAAPPSAASCSEVYAIAGYTHTRATAQAKCASYGGTLATMSQLLAAQIAGADWCSTGWLADMSGAYYPITTRTGSGCGNGSPGIKAYTPALAGANCFGPKPKQAPFSEVLAFSTGGWNQPNACAASALNYVNPAKEAFQNYGPPVYVSESTFPLNKASFGMDMARNKGGPRLESMFVEPLRSLGDEEETRILSKTTIRPDRATSYKYLRFKPVKTRDPANPTVDVGKFRFLLGDNEVDMGAAKVTNPMGTWVGDMEDVIGGGFKRGWSDAHKRALVFAFPYAMLLDGFTWTTANPDSGIGGDPVQWKLEGSQNGVYWTTLRDQTKHNYAVPTARFQELPVFRF
jgi:hypothetical protein